MTYRIEFAPTADADIARLSRSTAQRVLNRIRWMADNAEVVRHIALTGQYGNMFRLRIGDYRAIYSYDRTERKIVVHFIRHRSEAYRSRGV